MGCLKEEIRKIINHKIWIVFVVLCMLFNLALIAGTSSASGEWKKIAENYEEQSGEEIFRYIDGSALGSSYYDERYRNSDMLVAFIHEKYQKLEPVLEKLSEEKADVSTYAGEVTPHLHRALFGCLTKALIVEGILFFLFLTLELFYAEYYNQTAAIVYSSCRGRRNVFDKMFAVLVTGTAGLGVLSAVSYFIFFRVWDFSKIWDSNVASSYNYINDYQDPIFRKPFITWTSFTVRQYFAATIGLMICIWLIWWLFSTIFVLLTKKISVTIGVIAVCLFLPFFGLFLFTGLPELYFLNSFSITVNVYISQMWFTDLGYYTLFPYQETWSVVMHLLTGVLGIGVVYELFCRKDIY